MKKSLKTLSVLAAVLAGCALLCQQAQAGLMAGSIEFGGLCALDNPSLGSALGVTAWGTVKVGVATGDFATFVNSGDVAAFHAPWRFNLINPIPGFWSVDGFTFNLNTSSVQSQDNTFLEVVGAGVVSGNGFDPTAGTFSFAITGSNGTRVFDFSAESTTIPDGGMTLALLGIAMSGVEGLRRKLAK